MNAIDMLKAQHRQVERLFNEIRKANGQEKQQLFFELADSLAIHTTIEERHFYPTVRAAQTEELVEESYEEHLEAKRTLAELLDMKVSSREFDEKIQVLEEQITHHVGEEEDELFPKVERLLDQDQLEGVGQEMTATAAELADQEPRKQVPEEVAEASESSPPLH